MNIHLWIYNYRQIIMPELYIPIHGPSEQSENTPAETLYFAKNPTTENQEMSKMTIFKLFLGVCAFFGLLIVANLYALEHNVWPAVKPWGNILSALLFATLQLYMIAAINMITKAPCGHCQGVTTSI